MSINNCKEVIICANTFWNIYNFRLKLISDLKILGYRVIAVAGNDGYEAKVKNLVDDIYTLKISNKGINPIQDIITILQLIRVLKIVNADFVLLYTIKPVIYGSMVSIFFKSSFVATITGLGSAFLEQSWVTRLVRFMYKFGLKNVSKVVFQNKHDKEFFINNGLIAEEKSEVINGSGIDLNKFKLAPLNNKNEFKFVLIARLIKDKGILEFAEAAKQVKKDNPMTKFFLIGPSSVNDRGAIKLETINKWNKDGYIEYIGESEDVIKHIQDSSCVILPSYREGISKVLLEASAIGRPIITCDVPGCKDIVIDNHNGFLCKPRDAIDLEIKIKNFLSLPFSKRQDMGLKARERVEKYFSHEVVFKKYQKIIEEFSQ